MPRWPIASRRCWRPTRNTIDLSPIRHGVSPLTAVTIASWLFLQYFTVELLFGVPNPFGRGTDAALGEMVDILKFGMLQRPR